jgi:hypothetical protein
MGYGNTFDAKTAVAAEHVRQEGSDVLWSSGL